MEDVQESVLGYFLIAGSDSGSPGNWSSIKENSDLQAPRFSSENEALETMLSKRLLCFVNTTSAHLLFCPGSGVY